MEPVQVALAGVQQENAAGILKENTQGRLLIDQTLKPQSEEGKVRRHRLKPTKPLPSGRLKADKELEMIRSYAVQSNSGQTGVHFNEVAKLIEMHETSVSASKEFWEAIGALVEVTRGQHKPAPEVLSWVLKVDFAPIEANRFLHKLYDSAWFGGTTRQAFAVHKHLNSERLIGILAGTAGGEKQETDARVKTLIDILTLTAYLNKSENGDLTFTGSEASTSDMSKTVAAAPNQVISSAEQESGESSLRPNQAPNPESLGTNVRVEINIAADNWPVSDVIQLIKYLRSGIDGE